MKIRKGDEVIIRSGKDKGKKGQVISVDKQLNRVVVDGINIIKRHKKPSQAHPKGGIIESPAPLHASNVGLVNPDDTSKSSRIGFIIKSGKKVRVFRQASNKEVK